MPSSKARLAQVWLAVLFTPYRRGLKLVTWCSVLMGKVVIGSGRSRVSIPTHPTPFFRNRLDCFSPFLRVQFLPAFRAKPACGPSQPPPFKRVELNLAFTVIALSLYCVFGESRRTSLFNIQKSFSLFILNFLNFWGNPTQSDAAFTIRWPSPHKVKGM